MDSYSSEEEKNSHLMDTTMPRSNTIHMLELVESTENSQEETDKQNKLIYEKKPRAKRTDMTGWTEEEKKIYIIEQKRIYNKKRYERKKAEDPTFRQTKNEKNKASRNNIKKRNQIAKVLDNEVRSSQSPTKKENLAAILRKLQSDDEMERLEAFRATFEQSIGGGCDYVCTCCARAFFEISVASKGWNPYLIENKVVKPNFFRYKKMSGPKKNKFYMCHGCNNYKLNALKAANVDKVIKSPMCYLNDKEKNMKFPKIPKSIKKLNSLELLMSSPRVEFMKIVTRSYGGQARFQGNIINVENSYDSMSSVLPRKPDNLHLIVIEFKRKKSYEKVMMKQIVRPGRIIKALKYLSECALIKKKGINIDKEFLKMDNNDPDEFYNKDYVIQIDNDGNIESKLVRKEDMDKNKNEHFSMDEEEEKSIDADSDESSDCHSEGSEEVLSSEDEETKTNKKKTYLSLFRRFLRKKNKFFELDWNAEGELREEEDHREVKPDYFAPNQVTGKMQETLIIAPCEENRPIPIVQDHDVASLAFLKLFAAVEKKQWWKCLAQLYKSEFARYNIRMCRDVSYLFWSYKHLERERVLKALGVEINKHNLETDLTVKQALDDQFMGSLYDQDDASSFLRQIRGSNPYWLAQRLNLFAMIGKLGPPTLFMTLSNSEMNWCELVRGLIKRRFNVELDLYEVSKIKKEKVLELVCQDPVYVARYYEFRCRKLMRIIEDKHGPFKDHCVLDYVSRLEPHKSGNLHRHLIIWLKDAPIYIDSQPTIVGNNKQTEKEKMQAKRDHLESKLAVEQFADKYITCHRPAQDWYNMDGTEGGTSYNADALKHSPFDCVSPETKQVTRVSIKFQLHGCRRNCQWSFKYRDENENEQEFIFCKYGHPWPILDKTTIIEPLVNVERSVYHRATKNYIRIRSLLNKIDKENRENKQMEIFTQEKFLKRLADEEELNLDEGGYLEALSASIKRVTLFLKRNSIEIRINPYNKFIYLLHRSNMDEQFVINIKNLVIYVTKYLTKTNLEISVMMRKINSELLAGK